MVRPTPARTFGENKFPPWTGWAQDRLRLPSFLLANPRPMRVANTAQLAGSGIGMGSALTPCTTNFENLVRRTRFGKRFRGKLLGCSPG